MMGDYHVQFGERLVGKFHWPTQLDLSLSPSFLRLPEAGSTRNQANKWMKKAEAACEVAVQTQVMPVLESSVVAILGKSERHRFEFLKDTNTNSLVILFHYPSSQPTGFAYLKRSVKLEFGSLTDQKPIGYHKIQPWIAEVIPAAFPDWRCEVVALGVDRTFWEKATILNTEYYRPSDKPTPDRFSRHYADTAALASHPVAISAINQHDLRKRVVLWKSQFVGSSWANYDLAQPGNFHLIPRNERLPALERDYQSMRDMYLTKPVSFDEVCAILSNLEQQINEMRS